MFDVSDAYKTAIAKQSRSFKLGGEIRLKSGAVVEITDGNVLGELSISTQMMSGGQYDDTIDIGANTSAVLSMTICDDNSANNFADARVRLLVGLELEDGTYEYVKMGIFYIDSPTIKRVKNIISFTAYDKMIFLHYLLTDTMRSNMENMDAYGAAGYLCSLVGIRLRQTHDEVAAFPNGSVALSFTDKSIETARDAIMWCGQLMGCFTRIDRSGMLEFVQIKAENSESTGMIIPVREISANQRYSTKFADEVLRISTLTMKKTDGKIARAYLSGTSSSKRSLELELEQNPLLTGQANKSVADALKDILKVLKTAYFRPFSSETANDPALDAGDYVRLRGGAIDTTRGYATGMITHSIWRYRGKQDIVNVGSTPVLSQLEDNTSSVKVMALSAESDDGEESGDISGEEVVYAQPRAQSEKAAGMGACDGKLHDVRGTAANGFLAGYGSSTEFIQCVDAGGNTVFEVGLLGGVLTLKSGNSKIELNDSANSIEIKAGDKSGSFSSANSNITLTTGDGLKLKLDTGGSGVSTLKIAPPKGYGKEVTIRCGNDGYNDSGILVDGHSLLFSYDGLLYDGKRVVTEDIT